MGIREPVASMLERVTFEPFPINVKLIPTGRVSDQGGVDFRITVPNSYRPSETRTLHMGGSVPSWVNSTEDFYDWSLGTLIWFAEHETREWFKVNGKPWRDPHGYGQPQEYNERAMFDRVVRTMRPRYRQPVDSWSSIGSIIER